MEATHNVDHIRKELGRLGKMARLMQMRELAHFIDVAAAVAAELRNDGTVKTRTAKHA